MSKINPAWKAYNDLINEGGEGFNPHPKYIASTVAATVRPAAVATNKMLRDQRGNLIPADKLQSALDKDLARLAKITDASARALTEQSIAHARQQLGL